VSAPLAIPFTLVGPNGIKMIQPIQSVGPSRLLTPSLSVLCGIRYSSTSTDPFLFDASTGPAMSMAAFVDAGIHIIERVAVDACWLGGRAVTRLVRSVVYRLKVCWIYALDVVAQMVDLEPIGDRSNDALVQDSMRPPRLLFAGIVGDSIAVPIERSLPFPAAGLGARKPRFISRKIKGPDHRAHYTANSAVMAYRLGKFR
jgi:hypothetical protein